MAEPISIYLVAFGYLFTLFVNLIALRKINLSSLSFLDGLTIGLTYYIMIPMAVILISGRIGPDFIKIDDYLPYEDLQTTGIILGGSLAILILQIFVSFLFKRADTGNSLVYADAQLAENAKMDRRRSQRYTGFVCIALLLLYFPTSLTFFFVSGVASGEHWYRATADLMSDSPSFVIIKYLSNYARTGVFGALGAYCAISPRSRVWVLPLAVLIALIDLFTTFNRITLLYLFVMFIIAYRQRIILVSSSILTLLFSGIWMSSMWPEFRGQVAIYGYSLSGMASALEKAVQVTSQSSLPLVDKMNGMFESMSFSILNYTIKHASRLDVPLGSYYIRPLTVFIPRSIWPDRPVSFATTIGSEIVPASRGELALNSFVFGEPFANSSYGWPVLLLIVIIFYDLAFRAMSRRSPAWGGVGALVAFAWWRFDASFPFVCLLFSAMTYLILWFVLLLARGRA
jgi:hypothetical protein